MINGTANFILEHQIVTICRRIYGEQLLKLVSALYEGGIRLVEVTFDQSDENGNKKTAEAIEMLSKHFDSKMLIGAGTVLSKEQVLLAKEAGAKYIISPNVDDEVIKYTKELGLVSIPGAMTPSEIAHANKLGADIVKVFPAGYLGLKYVKDIKAPLSHIKLLAAGGINEENIAEFRDAGYNGFGISGRLTDKNLLAEKDYEEFTNRAEKFLKALKVQK